MAGKRLAESELGMAREMVRGIADRVHYQVVRAAVMPDDVVREVRGALLAIVAELSPLPGEAWHAAAASRARAKRAARRAYDLLGGW